MDSNLQLFDFEGNQVRTLEIKNDPFIVLLLSFLVATKVNAEIL
ncbi:hypothetical protein [Lactobacillus helveticus]|nr:hypothetical protein [Lactobacillus helveticus]